MYWETKKFVTHFILTFALSQWSGTEPAIYLQSVLYRRNEGTEESALKHTSRGFPGGAVVENLSANAGDTGSSPGLGRSHMPRSG